MIPSCKNCYYCTVIQDNEYISPEGTVTQGKGLKTFVCDETMSFKHPDVLCSKWIHKNKFIRKIWRLVYE